jgi:hypothetical protein
MGSPLRRSRRGIGRSRYIRVLEKSRVRHLCTRTRGSWLHRFHLRILRSRCKELVGELGPVGTGGVLCDGGVGAWTARDALDQGFAR